jgi:hypothetical protein
MGYCRLKLQSKHSQQAMTLSWPPLEIKNPNQGLNSFSVRLREMEPNLLPSEVYLPDIPFPPHGKTGDILKSGQTVRVDIFYAKRTSQTEIVFIAGFDDKGRIAATWRVTPQENIALNFEITAIGVPMQSEKVKVAFPKDKDKPVFTIEMPSQEGLQNTPKIVVDSGLSKV